MFTNMPTKEILAAIQELQDGGWRVQLTSGRAHAYAKAYCPGGSGCCDPVLVRGTPRVPEYEAAKLRRALSSCEHSDKEKT